MQMDTGHLLSPQHGQAKTQQRLDILHSRPQIPDKDIDTNSSPNTKSPHGGERPGGALCPEGPRSPDVQWMGEVAQDRPTITRLDPLYLLPVTVGIWVASPEHSQLLKVWLSQAYWAIVAKREMTSSAFSWFLSVPSLIRVRDPACRILC